MATQDRSSDFYKCTKISTFIPSIVKSINEIEGLNALYKMNLDLETSKRRFNSIASVKQSLSNDEVEDFREHLFAALTSLASGINTLNLQVLEEDKREVMVGILADISNYQEDINRVATG